MIYKIFIDTGDYEEVAKTDDYEEMIFLLNYLIRVKHWKRKAIALKYDNQLNYEGILYTYNGDIDNFIEWNKEHDFVKSK